MCSKKNALNKQYISHYMIYSSVIGYIYTENQLIDYESYKRSYRRQRDQANLVS